MSSLSFITRAGSSPYGKPKVYFTCHKKDFDRFFKSICDDILNFSNCAIYYNDPNAEQLPENDWELELGQMQLFVIPITSRLLCSANRTLDVEIPFAMEHHIPVLPLMQEGGLENLFNEKCGNLQFLEKGAKDPTAIPYEEKLRAYLGGILVNDELAAKIRAAFDGYIFMSYRKKDRKFAQELMRLIHKNDFCRDIAIWYDEFLTPGEDFNSAIEAALEKCGLFVLTVTPNLVNEGNYIIDHEYPAAREMEKPILPVEMVETDADRLAEEFQNIPPCVNAHREDALSEALLQGIRTIALRENDADPQHNFFVGLAYLSGIDVEVDQERAVKLITSAADAGLLEAISKLVEMYQTGQGVERSYQTAVQWQEKKIAALEEQYRQDPSRKKSESVLTAILDCADAYKDLGDDPRAMEKYQAYLAFFDSTIRDSANDYNRQSLAICLDRIGNIFSAQGDWAAAKEYHEKSCFGILKPQAERTKAVYDLKFLSLSYLNLGHVYKNLGDQKSAEAFYHLAYETSEHIASRVDFVGAHLGENKLDRSIFTDVDRVLASTSAALADFYEQQEDYANAEAYMQKAAALTASVAEEENGPYDRHNLIVENIHIASLYEKRGKLEEAAKYYQICAELSEAFVADTKMVLAYGDLVESYSRLGNLHLMQGELSAAQIYFQKAMETSNRFFEETGTEDACVCQLQSYGDMHRLFLAYENLDEAENCCKHMIEISEELEKKTGTITARQRVASCYSRMGKLYIQKNDLPQAKTYMEMCLEARKRLAEQAGTVATRAGVYSSRSDLGRVLRGMGDNQGAQALYEENLRDSLAAVKSGETIDGLSRLLASYNDLGDHAVEQGDIAKAQEYFKKSAEIVRKLTVSTENVGLHDALALNYTRMGNLFKEQGELDAALEYFAIAVDIYSELTQKSDALYLLEKLNNACYLASYICNQKSDEKGMRKYLEKVVEVREKLLRKKNSVEAAKEVISACLILCDTCRTQEDWQAVQRYGARALDFCQRLTSGKEKTNVYSEMLKSCRAVGEACQRQGKMKEAKDCYKYEHSVLSSLAKSVNASQLWFDMVICLGNLGFISTEQNELQEAKAYFEENLSICEYLMENVPPDVVRRYLAIGQDCLGSVCKDLGETEQAKNYYTSAVHTYLTVVEEEPTVGNYDSLAEAYMHLAEVDDSEKMPSFKQAHEIWSMILKHYPDRDDIQEKRDYVKSMIDELKP